MWLFIHFFALAFFILLMMIIERINVLESAFSFLGKYAGAIFVCHPIARIIVKNISHNWGIGWELGSPANFRGGAIRRACIV